MLLGVVYLLVNQPQLFLCDKGEKCVFSPAELTAALPHRFFLSLWVPSSHDWGTQRESQRASLAPNKENHKVNSIKSRTEDKQDDSSSPLQLIGAVLSLQTVRHTAPALVVVVDHLYLNAPEMDNTDSSIWVYRKYYDTKQNYVLDKNMDKIWG